MGKLSNSLTAGICALALVSCTSVSQLGSSRLDSKLDIVPGGQAPGDHDPVAKAAFWGTRYDREPNNAEAAVKFSEALRTVGSNEESLKVMSRIHRQFSDRADVSLEYGKSLIANERAFEAVRPIEKAISLDKGRDWKAYSAYGVALDKIGEHRSARMQYDVALKLQPSAHTVLNNKGLSYALSGKLDQAELTLRYAAATSTGTATVRQNLALILSFKGDVAEAERLARSDLPPRIAENNIAYFRSLVSQPAYWQEFTGDNVEMPTFDAPATSRDRFETAPMPDVPASAPPTNLAPPKDPEPESPQPNKPSAGADVLSSVVDDYLPVPGQPAENEWGMISIIGSSANKPLRVENAAAPAPGPKSKPADDDQSDEDSGA